MPKCFKNDYWRFCLETTKSFKILHDYFNNFSLKIFILLLRPASNVQLTIVLFLKTYLNYYLCCCYLSCYLLSCKFSWIMVLSWTFYKLTVFHLWTTVLLGLKMIFRSWMFLRSNSGIILANKTFTPSEVEWS